MKTAVFMPSKPPIDYSKFPIELQTPIKADKKIREKAFKNVAEQCKAEFFNSGRLVDAEVDNIRRRTTAREAVEKWGIVFDYYDIKMDEDDAWKKIALNIANDFIPSFQFAEEKRGSKKKIDDITLYELWYEVRPCREKR